MHKCQFKPNEPQEFRGTKAEQKVHENKLEEQQQRRETIMCEGSPLINSFKFKYLGSIFAADGDHTYDVRRRTALAMTRMGQLRQVFNSDIGLGLKLRIYKTAVCSLFTYGSESWFLDDKTMATINGANARCLSRITGKSCHLEASSRTRTYDLVGAIRQRRKKWLGHILRMRDGRLVKHAVTVQFTHAREGNIFQDIPSHLSFETISTIAKDRRKWKRLLPTLSSAQTNALINEPNSPCKSNSIHINWITSYNYPYPHLHYYPTNYPKFHCPNNDRHHYHPSIPDIQPK